jgi:HPr kinase/phosphorylase
MLREAATRPQGDGDASTGAIAPPSRATLHASCVVWSGAGVVLIGPSGSGKSDLAVRLIDAGAQLVADDQLTIERCGDRLIGRPHEALAGLIEVRGLGIMRVGHCPSCPLGLVVALDCAGPWPRLPERASYELLGVALPYLRLDPRTPSACAKIKLALAAERVD